MGTHKNYMRTLDKILSKVDTKRGAPLGRMNVGSSPKLKRTYDCRVYIDRQGYDVGGAYWGAGSELRVTYTKDLTYIKFYRP